MVLSTCHEKVVLDSKFAVRPIDMRNTESQDP